MALFSKVLVASSVLASLALAAPLNQARDLVFDVVTETVWTTLDVTTTIYGNDAAGSSSTPAVVSTSSTPAAAAVVPTPSSSLTPVAEPTSIIVSMTSTLVVSTVSASSSSSFSSPAAAAAAAVVTSSAAGDLALASTNTIASTVSAAAAAPIAASSSGTCEGTSNACVGDVTYWTGGLGACGTVVDTNSDYAIALPYEFMGTLSNTNPYCGRTVTLLNPTSGTTVQATVMDKCMGCVDRAIDCTELLFNAITDNLGNGRESGIEWWLN